MAKKPAVIAVMLCLLGGAVSLMGAVLDCDIFIFDGRLTAGIDPAALFNSELVEGLHRGFPLHLDLTAELKESLPAWFDPVLQKYRANVEIEYRAFGSRFYARVIAFDGNPHEFSSKNFGELAADLKDFLIISAGDIEHFDPQKSLYFSFNLKLRRLTARELGRASDWYRGKERVPGDSFENKGDVPDRIFEQILNISGLGPIKYNLQSRIFKPADLRKLHP